MDLSSTTASLLATLDKLSHNTLGRRTDLGVLIELATLERQQDTLDELSFTAKFLHRSLGIMRRIGKDGNGYDKLESEFKGNLQKASTLVGTLIRNAPEETRQHFTSTYLGLTPGALENFMMLLHDLSWYKNWLIDRSRGSR